MKLALQGKTSLLLHLFFLTLAFFIFFITTQRVVFITLFGISDAWGQALSGRSFIYLFPSFHFANARFNSSGKKAGCSVLFFFLLLGAERSRNGVAMCKPSLIVFFCFRLKCEGSLEERLGMSPEKFRCINRRP